MLINNLQQHRQKYANLAKTGSLFQIQKPHSATKIMHTTAKTETSSAFKCKFGSQKKIRMDPHYTTTGTNSIVSKFDLYEKSNFMNKNAVKFIDGKKSNKQSGAGRKPLFFKTEQMKYQQRRKQGTQRMSEGYNKTEQPTYNQFTYRKQSSELKNERKTTQTLINTDNSQQCTSTRKIQQPNKVKTMNKISSKQNDEKRQYKVSGDEKLRLTTSIATVKSNYKSIVVEPQKTRQQKERQQNMMRQLKFHDVFFCAYCYRYVFAIEKNYHFPKCQTRGQQQKLDDHSKYKMGIQKLNLLVELSDYTKYKTAQIKQIHSNIANQNKIPQTLAPLKGQSYYTLLEIQDAAHIIIRKLILPYLQSGKQYFCNNIVCDRVNQM